MIDYYELFYENMAQEIDPFSSKSAGGTMSCPAQIVDRDKEYIEENIQSYNKQNITVDKEILKFYMQLAWMKIIWKPSQINFNTEVQLLLEDKELFPEAEKDVKAAICAGRPPLRGHIKIETLPSLINGPKGKKWKDILWFDEMDAEEKEYWQQFMVFDYSVPECLILLKKTGNVVEDKLYYHYKDNAEAYDLNIGIEKYLNIAYKVKGFEGWQYALAKRSSNYEYILKRMKHYLPQIFPKLSYDFSDFE